MPMQSQQQRKYLWATDEELARKFEDETPKGAKLPKRVKKKHQKKAFFVGFWSQLEKASKVPLVLKDTLGPQLDMLPARDYKAVSKMKLDILRDPTLSKVERNQIIARLEDRIERSGPQGHIMQLGAGLSGDAAQAINLYLAAKNHPRSSAKMLALLRLGMLGAMKLGKGTEVIDRRRSFNQERHSQWKLPPDF